MTSVDINKQDATTNKKDFVVRSQSKTNRTAISESRRNTPAVFSVENTHTANKSVSSFFHSELQKKAPWRRMGSYEYP